jgi:hypothetical protein
MGTIGPGTALGTTDFELPRWVTAVLRQSRPRPVLKTTPIFDFPPSLEITGS